MMREISKLIIITGFFFLVVIGCKNLLTKSVNAAGCKKHKFVKGSAPSTVKTGNWTDTGEVRCNFGGVYDCISPVLNSEDDKSPWKICNYVGFEGKNAKFTCLAVSTAGSYKYKCKTFSGTAGKCCNVKGVDGVVKVELGPTATPTATPGPTATLTPTQGPTATPEPTLTPACNLKTSGDANCDGVVNTADFDIWKCEFLGGGTCASPASVKTASFDLNDRVDLIDYEIWRKNSVSVNLPTGAPSATAAPTATNTPIPTTTGVISPTVILNEASGKSCNSLCPSPLVCTSVGTNTPGTDTSIFEYSVDHCNLVGFGGNCDSIMTDRQSTNPPTCGGFKPAWTYCKCVAPTPPL